MGRDIARQGRHRTVLVLAREVEGGLCFGRCDVRRVVWLLHLLKECLPAGFQGIERFASVGISVAVIALG